MPQRILLILFLAFFPTYFSAHPAEQGRLQAPRTPQQIEVESHLVQAQEPTQEIDPTALAKEQQREPLSPLLQQAAEHNIKLTQQLKALAKSREFNSEKLKLIESKLRQLEHNYQRALQQLEITTIDKSVGEFLRSQRAKLPDEGRYEKQNILKEQELAETRLAHFRLQDQTAELLDHRAVRERYLSRYAKRLSRLSETQQKHIRYELDQLLNTRKDLLKSLDVAYTQNAELLDNLISSQRKLIQAIKKYRKILDENLLWIANTEPISRSWLSSVTSSISILLAPQAWLNSTYELSQLALEQFWIFLIVGLLTLTLFAIRPRLHSMLAVLAENVGKVQRDRFSHTLFALLATALLAAPWPILMRFAGWLLQSSATPFSKAVGTGLWYGAEVFFVLLFLATLYIRNGLAESHFQWAPRPRKVVARNLSWLMPLVVISVVLIGMTESRDLGTYRDTIARLAYGIQMLAVMLFTWRILRKRSGILKPPQETRHPGLSWRARYLWYPLALVTPLVFIGLAAQGYFYTSLQLTYLVFRSAAIIILAFLINQLAVRWLVVAHRRLALKRAREKRQSAIDSRATREAAEQAGEIATENIEIPEIGLDAINEQTRRLIRMALFVASALILWFTWKEVAPAFNVLQNIRLWEHTVLGTDGEQVVSVTLANVALALIVLLVTFAAKRNIPGLVEIAVLQPLAVEPGNRYAVISISRYIILTIGFVAAFTLLGIRWQEIQWLVAAVGVGLGFGLKEIFANFMSGLIILFERPVRVGDTVTIQDVSGVITRIRMRATTLTDWDNKELIIPNQALITEPLINWTLSDQVTRVRFVVGIAYGSDTERAHKIIMDTISAHPLVLDDPAPTVLFLEFGESSLNFEVRVFVKERIQRMPLTHELHMALEKALKENGIEVPFPQRDLHLRSIDKDIQLPPNTNNQ